MAKLNLQVKNLLTLVCSAALSVSAGIAARRWDSGSSRWIAPAAVAVLVLCLQALLLVAVQSKEEEELALARKGRMESLTQDQNLNKSLGNAMQKALDEGRIQDFNEMEKIRERYRG